MIRKFAAVVATVIAVTSAISIPAMASGDGSARTERRFGIYGGTLSEPYPSLWGLSLGYNVTDLLQLDLSFGNFTYQTVTVATTGWGIKFQVPGWSLSPYLSLNSSVAAATGTIQISGQNVAINGNLAIVSSKVGLEWLTHAGLLFGAGIQSPVGIPFAGLNLVGAYLGYYF